MSFVNIIPQSLRPQLMARFGDPIPPPAAPPPEPLPEPKTLEQARAIVGRLEKAAAPFAALAKAKLEAVAEPAMLGGNSGQRFREAQAEDAKQAWREAAAGEPLSCLSYQDRGRAYRALLGDPRGQIIGDYFGAVELATRAIPALEARQVAADFEEAAKDLRKLDLEFARALLRCRDLWFARIAQARKIPRPPFAQAHTLIRLFGDRLYRVMECLKNARRPEDIIG